MSVSELSYWLEPVALFAIGVVAGGINLLAGGGSFLIFPALLALGVDPLVANATNNIAVWPGNVAATYSYRKRIDWTRARPYIALCATFAIFGGWLAVRLGTERFGYWIPLLLFVATLVLVLSEPLSRRAERFQAGLAGRIALVLAMVMLAVYAGFFGAGFGIVVLAVLTALGVRDFHEAIATKIVLATTVNSVASLYLGWHLGVHWPYAIALMGGTVVGGLWTGRHAQQIEARKLRQVVAVYGGLLSVYYGWKTFLG